jgi:hypothetical protein
MGTKAFNHLPSYIKELSDDKIQFKNIFKKIVNFDVNDIIGAFSWINM